MNDSALLAALVQRMNEQCPSACGNPYEVDTAYCYGGVTITLASRHLFRRMPKPQLAEVLRAWLDGAQAAREYDAVLAALLKNREDADRINADYAERMRAAATRKAIKCWTECDTGSDCDPVTGAEYGVPQ